MSNLWVTPEELGADYAETEFAYEAAKSASYLLWALSGRKYSGTTTVTERYSCAGRTYRYGPSVKNNDAVLIDGDVYNIFSDNLDFYEDIATDGTTSSSRIRLRGRPVTKIHTIRNRTGEIISSDKYYLVDHSTIHAVTGVRWTPCNVEVTYSYGVDPPTLGKVAARTLAIEFAKLFNNEDDCALPQRVTSISRQGVSYTLLDSQDFIDQMRTGLYVVDMFLKSVNPSRSVAKARVFSPDMPRARRNTPKSLKYGESNLDITVPAGGTGTMNVSLDEINATFLLSGGWSPEVIIRNHAANVSKTLDGAGVVSDPTPTSVSISNKALASNVATITTAAAHGFYVGTEVVIAGVDATFNGTYTITQVPSTTMFQYARTASNVASAAASGTATSTTDDRITISVGYDDALEVLKMVDPGTYDLYGTREVSGVEETTYICSGNLKISLATTVINAYTIG
jgi:hypothetical protein